jgi:hypothetical protein
VPWLRFGPSTSRINVRRTVRLQRLGPSFLRFHGLYDGKGMKRATLDWACRSGPLHKGRTTEWMLDSDEGGDNLSRGVLGPGGTDGKIKLKLLPEQ